MTIEANQQQETRRACRASPPDVEALKGWGASEGCNFMVPLFAAPLLADSAASEPFQRYGREHH